MNRILTAMIFCAVPLSMTAQELTSEQLKEISGAFVKDAPTRAIQNALTSNYDIRDLAKNNALEGKIDHYFKYKVNVKGITDQKRSGRCWMFTSMNTIRPLVMEKFNLQSFDFSHNYSYFYDMLEKSNLFLEAVISTAKKDMGSQEVSFYFKSPVSDGGVWNMFPNIAGKYGVVPDSIMPETAHSQNTANMRSIINERLRAGGLELRELVNSKAGKDAVSAAKTAILKDVYRVLALCLGEPPAEFTWRYKDKDGNINTLKTTPLEFYRSIVPEDYDMDTYIMVMNDPTREYYRMYEIENYRNTFEGSNWRYLNLPSDVIKAAALASIKANEAIYTSCDVSKQFDSSEGISDPEMYDYESLFGIDLSMDKAERILTRHSSSTHAMALVGADTDDTDKPVKWMVENSWGADAGHNGYITMTDAWFDEYMFRFVINRKYLDEKSLKAAESKTIMLPAWDFMY